MTKNKINVYINKNSGLMSRMDEYVKENGINRSVLIRLAVNRYLKAEAETQSKQISAESTE